MPLHTTRDNAGDREDSMGESEERPSITTVAGLKVGIKPVSRVYLQQIARKIQREFEQAGKMLEPPTYKVITAGGGVETYPHDETSIADAPEEDKALWAAYQANRAEADNRVGVESTKFQVLKGLIIDEVPKAWVKEQQELGFDVPKDAKDLLWAYIEREVIVTPEDVFTALTAITALSMRGSVSEEAIKAAADTFRREVAKQAPGDAAPAEG